MEQALGSFIWRSLTYTRVGPIRVKLSDQKGGEIWSVVWSPNFKKPKKFNPTFTQMYKSELKVYLVILLL